MEDPEHNSESNGVQHSARALARAAKHQEELDAAQIRNRARLAAIRLAEQEEQERLQQRQQQQQQQAASLLAAGRDRDESEQRFIANEVAEVRVRVPQEQLRSCTPDCVQVVISASRVRTLLLKAFFPAGYPATPLALELEPLLLGGSGSSCGGSSTNGGGGSRLSEVLMGKLQAGVDAEVRKHAGGRQVLHAVHWLHECLVHNRLAAAYDDIQQLRAAAATATTSTPIPTPNSNSKNNHSSAGPAAAATATHIPTTPTTTTAATTTTTQPPACSLELRSVKERSGVVEVVLRCGAYFLHLRCVVPERYPDDGVELHCVEANLPADLLAASLAGAGDLVRRLAEPLPLLARLDVGRAGAGTGCTASASTTATTTPSSSTPSTPHRRRAGTGQTLHSEAKAAALAASAAEGAAARAAARAAAAAAHEPRPSLWPAVHHLGERCVAALGGGRCAVCSRRLLPADAAKLAAVPAEMALLRLVTCGHFFHHKCIESFLAAPPFGRDGCPVAGCGERISHHRLVTEPKVLEARWAGRQARRREVEDAASILGL